MQKADRYDLTQGGILQKLVMLGLPIMAGNLVMMLYNLADMFWLGRLGSHAVAASGTVGTFMWLSMALENYGNKGAEIGVAQSLGRGSADAAKSYAASSLALAFYLGLFFSAIIYIFRAPLIGFFNIQEPGVVADTETYLVIICLGFPFAYVSMAVMGCFSGSGNSLTTFYISALCLLLNIVLDPLLIFTAGMGIAGAAWATVIAQALNCVLLVAALLRYRHPALCGLRLTPRPRHLGQIARWATPIAVESFFFTFLVMVFSRFVAAFGAGAIASQRIGTQVESLSWLVAGSFSSAFTAYVGQNYGAGKWRRIHRGFRISTASMALWGLGVTALLFFGAEGIFRLFLPGEPDIAAAGSAYLRFLAACQIFQCLEPTAAGAFRGQGRTIPPSVISIAVNTGRVVLAWVLSQTALGLNGIWLAVSIGSVVRGALVYLCYVISARRSPKEDVGGAPPINAI